MCNSNSIQTLIILCLFIQKSGRDGWIVGGVKNLFVIVFFSSIEARDARQWTKHFMDVAFSDKGQNLAPQQCPNVFFGKTGFLF